nr:phage tape measure protein [uncultured Mediterranean phage uvMED]
MAEYGINVVANVQAQQLKSLLTQLQQLKNAAKDVNKLKITGDVQEQKQSTAAVRERNKAIRENKKAQMEANRALLASSDALMGGANAIRNTTAMVRTSQKEVKKYSRDWNDLQRLITKLDFSSAFKDLQHLDKIARQTAQAFELMQVGGEGFPNFAGKLTLNELLKFEPANTTKALQTYQEVLQDVLADVDRGSEIYREFAARIEEVNRRLTDTSTRKAVPTAMQYGKPIGPERGPGFFGSLRQSTRFRDIATGAGFPLLFGGGPLQALGGGIGGGLGGLGGAIAGSAIVSQIEAFGRAAAEVGVKVTSTAGTLELLREKSLFADEAQEALAAKYQRTGEVGKLAALVTGQLSDQIGNKGVLSLRELGKQTKQITKLWGLLTTQLFSLVSGPLTKFLAIVNSVLERFTTEQKLGARLENLSPEKAALLQSELKRRTASTTKREVFAKGTMAEFESTTLVPGEKRVDVIKDLLGQDRFKLPGLPTIVTPTDLQDLGGNNLKEQVALLGVRNRLTNNTLTLDALIAQAELDKNFTVKETLEIEKARQQFLARNAELGIKEMSEAEQAALFRESQLQFANDLYKIGMVRIKLESNTLEPLEKQKQFLQETLEFGREEATFRQLIRESTENMPEPLAKAVEQYLRGNKALQDQITLAEQMKSIFDQIGMTIKDGVVESISAAVEGTKTLGEVASNTLRNIANMLLNLGVNMALFGVPTGVGKKDSGGLLSGIFGRANGGAVGANRPYMVGERGPELFVPGAQGNIVPNNAMGSTSVVVNVDASGTEVQGNQGGAEQLGRLIGSAVQAELIKQKRPGGLLTR